MTGPSPPAVDEAVEHRGSRTNPKPALVEADLLVEDVSIDGMCGVY